MRVCILLVFIFLISCTTNSDPSNHPGASVTLEEAKKIAKDVYNLSLIEKDVSLRLLKDLEEKSLTPEQKSLTPVYYVIPGKIGDKDVTIFVSSNEASHHFIIENPQ